MKLYGLRARTSPTYICRQAGCLPFSELLCDITAAPTATRPFPAVDAEQDAIKDDNLNEDKQQPPEMAPCA
jgi:hypothetical protein